MTNIKNLKYITCILLSTLISSPLWTMNLSEEFKEKLEDVIEDKQDLIEEYMPEKGTEVFKEMCIEAFVGGTQVGRSYMNTTIQASQTGLSDNDAIAQGVRAADSTLRVIMQNIKDGKNQILNEAQNKEFNAFSEAFFPHACDVMLMVYVEDMIADKDSDDDL